MSEIDSHPERVTTAPRTRSRRRDTANAADTATFSDIAALRRMLATFHFEDERAEDRAAALRTLHEQGLACLPLPGHGRTLERWAALAAVAACDLALVKLYEGHTDALTILTELGAHPLVATGIWGVWAADPPRQRVIATPDRDDRVRLDGMKPWCSGGPSCSHALVTAWLNGDPILVAIDLAQPSVTIDGHRWQALGMAATGTSDVTFERSLGWQIGPADAYLARPGFWHGGAGIAACWFGSLEAIARALHAGIAGRADPRDPHALAHLGAVDARISEVAALLRETAAAIDRAPRTDARAWALRARLSVEAAAFDIIERTGRVLGPMPFCGDRWFARAMADLPVFLRQSHAERDAAVLADTLIAGDLAHWSLEPTGGAHA